MKFWWIAIAAVIAYFLFKGNGALALDNKGNTLANAGLTANPAASGNVAPSATRNSPITTLPNPVYKITSSKPPWAVGTRPPIISKKVSVYY
jgi:hypothetical protein